ncbi:periplasmic chaperone for outer membrane proteins SurA [Roseovarius nanhaiticus]|uniref:Parvulin-like PPIase n=1 Tax=Roseovarius nanhaiticus TaxID=573024 RepID=A0A1N7GBU0_9RHOB|nr:SurA N-terminal domain-containing protein [Roseovarius nanhaiticus]SEK31451.1 periplasmic chaperone for outer membrane proteins SurA [Roseovarius nanhaiticus]SIS10053.1 periplasmic chaperone for outer membrane proteins SurA [Roseovarius nanhaiticus]
MTSRPLTAPRALRAALLGLALSVGAAGMAALPGIAVAQGLFDPVVKVNGAAITRYELNQRTELLKLLRAPADPARLAREQLIEDRLKSQAAAAQGITVSDEQIAAGMENFASQGSLSADQMIALLERGGVSRETFEAFVRSGLIWRELTQARFGARVSVSEADLERARAAIQDGTGVRVLLSEIIIPFEGPGEERAMAKAREISELTSTGAFSAQARQVSATRTREAGGRLPWQPITQLPPVLRPLVLGLAPGEVTDPLPLDGAVALFQLREIQETEVPEPSYSAIEYAAYYIPGGRTPEALARAAQVDAQTDTCDDLYGIAKDQPENVLERGTKAPGEIPNDIAISLSRLDPGEVSYDVTRANGQTLILLMMCGRSLSIDGAGQSATPSAEGEEAGDNTAQLSQQIAARRMESFANGYLEQLRAEARIIEY